MSFESESDHETTTPSRRRVIHNAAALTLAGISGETASETQSSKAPNRQTESIPKAGKSLGSQIRGVQHFGITVQNMNRAFEFYTEVLGGIEVMRDGDFHGEPIHNPLMLHEEIGARQQHINPHTVGIPDLRGGTQRLDVRFIQFDNMVIELLQYRDQNQPEGSGSSFAPPHARTSPSYPASAHICFYIKDDTDFDQFIYNLEANAAQRGMSNVRANRTLPVESDSERITAPLDANTSKIKQGRSNGWSLMYCKGPEGEQLEFVQVLGPVKQTFDGSLEKRRQRMGSKV
jgi:catechol 2,3-dioxygenase-like lactoylglutathione lyase family enzyme